MRSFFGIKVSIEGSICGFIMKVNSSCYKSLMKQNLGWSGLFVGALCICFQAPVLAAVNLQELASNSAVKIENLLAQAEENGYIAWANQCSSLVEREEFEEAIAACDNALEIKPDYSMGLTNRCVALGQINRYQEAIESCREALSGDGNWGDGTEAGGWTNFGGSLLLAASQEQGEDKVLPLLKQALAAFDKSLEIDPKNTKTQRLREELAALIQMLE